MKLELVDIPGLETLSAGVWKVQALVVGGRDPVRSALAKWQRESPNDYRAILKVMRIASQQNRVLNPKHVKPAVGASCDGVYEMIAYTRCARLMFFYDEQDDALIICTNEYEKGRGSQDAAFKRSAELRGLYFAKKSLGKQP